MQFVPPNINLSAFTCPHCNAYAQQFWSTAFKDFTDRNITNRSHASISSSVCTHCSDLCLWREGKLVHPVNRTAPHPNDDMPENVKEDYIEADSISALSPKAAAALLRLGLQKLCKHLGADGRNINDDIGFLVTRGLSPKIQKAMDVVRVVGNNAVHPGQIDTDNPPTVAKLFTLLNIITESMISEPKQIDEMYGTLPNGAKKGVEIRDAKKP